MRDCDSRIPCHSHPPFPASRACHLLIARSNLLPVAPKHAGINNDKHNFLDASLRVPLILRLPGVLPAGATREFATTLDITATIVAASGAAVPREYQV